MSQELPSDLRARVLAEARGEASPTRAQRQSRVLLAALLGVAPTVALSVWLGLPAKRSACLLACLAIAGALLALGATWAAVSRGRSMLGRSSAALATVAALVPLGLLLVAVLGASSEGPLALTGDSARSHLVCFVFTVLFAIGPFLAAAYARRSTDPVHPRALGAAIGAAAGAWGGALIDVHCSRTSIEHLLMGHVAPVVFLAAVGALVGARVLGVRATR